MESPGASRAWPSCPWQRACISACLVGSLVCLLLLPATATSDLRDQVNLQRGGRRGFLKSKHVPASIPASRVPRRPVRGYSVPSQSEASPAGTKEGAPGKNSEPLPPRWAPRFRAAFSEDTYWGLFTYTTTGVFVYDFASQRLRVDRENGSGDRYCGSALPFRTTPCTHLVVEGMRYLLFPEQQYCCKCCSAESGCGVVDRDWLANATYLGHSDFIFGTRTTKWNKVGLQNNYYWHADDDVPVRIYMEPIAQMTFNHSSYSQPSAFDDRLFVLPETLDCSPQCYGLCSVLQKEEGLQLL